MLPAGRLMLPSVRPAAAVALPIEARDHGEDRDQQVIPRMGQADGGREAGQEPVVAEERDRDRVGEHGRQHHREQRVHGELPQDDLHAEEHAGKRRVEGRSDPASRTAGDEDPHPVLRHPRPLAERRRQRGADLHDRALPAHRPPGADAHRRRHRLDGR
jgi:hypothetical protein